MLCNQITTAMTTLKNTQKNSLLIECLKKISDNSWEGNTTHYTVEDCLTVINFKGYKNSGWYKPSAVAIKGVDGLFMVNQDGSLCFDFRVVKVAENQFKVESMTLQGINEFENLFRQLSNE